MTEIGEFKRVDKLLPVIPAETGALIPASDQDRLDRLDESAELLVAAVRAKNFSDPTIRSILATRIRTYKERGEAWRDFTLHGFTPVEIEELQDDDDVKRCVSGNIIESTKASLGNKLGLDLREPVSETSLARNGQTHYFSEFSNWKNSNGLYVANELSDRVKSDYVQFLLSRGRLVVDQIATFLNDQQLSLSRTLIKTVAQDMVTRYGDESFGEFDKLFIERVQGGVKQLQDMEPLPAEPKTKGGWLRTIGRSAINNQVTSPSRTDSEREALSQFFNISQKMTTLVEFIKGNAGTHKFVAEFEATTGIGPLRDFIELKAEELLDQMLSAEKIEAFFDQYEEDVDAYFRERPRYSSWSPGRSHNSTTSSGSPEPEPESDASATRGNVWSAEYAAKRLRAQEGKRHFISTENHEGAKIIFDAVAPTEEATLAELSLAINDNLKKFTETDITDSRVLTNLCQAIAANQDTDKEGAPTDKKMWRRLMSAYHPDTIIQRYNRQATEDETEFAALLNSLFTLREQGKLTIDRDGDWSAINIVSSRA